MVIDPILNPTVFLGSLEWREPMTTLTDFLVALVSLYGFIRLYNYKGEKPAYFKYFKFYFLFFAIGMTAAAWLGHGLQAYVGPEYKRIGWACSATGLLSLAFASVTLIKHHIGRNFEIIIKTIIVAQYATFMTLMLHPALSDFIYAQLASTVALVGLILPMQIYNYVKTKHKGSLIIFLAIIYGIIPGTVYNNQISLSQWFNYHDISHVLVAIFMFLMIVGVSNIVRNPINQQLR